MDIKINIYKKILIEAIAMATLNRQKSLLTRLIAATKYTHIFSTQIRFYCGDKSERQIFTKGYV